MEDNKIPAGSQLPETQETVVEEVETVPAVEPKILAGKYKSPEELENAYINLEQKIGQQSGEVGAIREQNKMLTEQLLNQQAATPPEPAKDYDNMLSEIAKSYENDEMTFEEALRQSNAITAEQVQSATVQGLEGKFTELQNEFQSTLKERDDQKAVDSFHTANPDFLQLQESGVLEGLKQENPLHDDLSAYYAHKATQAYETGKEEHAREVAGSDPAKTVVSKPGANLQVKQKSNLPLSETEMKQSMLDSMG